MSDNTQSNSPNSETDKLLRPLIGVGAVVFKDEMILLVKRSKAPSISEWAIPGGRLEFGETMKSAAERELEEETGVIIRAGEPIYVFDAIERDQNGEILYHYVIIDLIAEYVSGDPIPADDALDAKWISREDLGELTVSERTLHLLESKFNFAPISRRV